MSAGEGGRGPSLVTGAHSEHSLPAQPFCFATMSTAAAGAASPAAGGSIAAPPSVMLFIKSESSALKEALTARLNPEARGDFEPCDIRVPDFDGECSAAVAASSQSTGL